MAGIISIHPPRGGRDPILICSASAPSFQSTLPVGGGTNGIFRQLGEVTISIHPPRKGRDAGGLTKMSLSPNFNPPSPWGEGRLLSSKCSPPWYFNPPSPWGEGPGPRHVLTQEKEISIHPPREGRDVLLLLLSHISLDFNPPSP